MKRQHTKPRRDCKLLNLDPEIQDRIAKYAKGKSQEAVAAWLRGQGFEVSQPTVGKFLAAYDSKQRFAKKAGITEALLEQIKKADPSISPERLRELGQAFFSFLVIESKDTRGWHLVQQIANKQGRLDLDREKFHDQAAERKARLQADLNQSSPTPGGLTDEAVKEITDKLKLL